MMPYPYAMEMSERVCVKGTEGVYFIMTLYLSLSRWAVINIVTGDSGLFGERAFPVTADVVRRI
jgi:hypothetical protein